MTALLQSQFGTGNLLLAAAEVVLVAVGGMCLTVCGMTVLTGGRTTEPGVSFVATGRTWLVAAAAVAFVAWRVMA